MKKEMYWFTGHRNMSGTSLLSILQHITIFSREGNKITYRTNENHRLHTFEYYDMVITDECIIYKVQDIFVKEWNKTKMINEIEYRFYTDKTLAQNWIKDFKFIRAIK